MDNPLNQHLISVTDDDTKTRANAKIPTFVKSITSPFEALHENAGEADPQTVTQLEERLIPTQTYQRHLEDMSIAKLQERQDVPLRDEIVTRLKTKLPAKEQHQHQDQDDDYCEVAKLKMQMPDDIAHPTVDIRQLKIKDAPIGTRVKIHTRRFDWAELEYDDEGESMLPYSHGKPTFTCKQIVARGDAQHAEQLRVCYDDGDLLWSQLTHLSDAATMNDASNVIDFIVTLASTQAPPPEDIPHLRINGEEGIPKNYLECLVLPDWRDWVMAANKEMKGWTDNQAHEEMMWATSPLKRRSAA
jgi:hypothetical protein